MHDASNLTHFCILVNHHASTNVSPYPGLQQGTGRIVHNLALKIQQ